MAYREYYTLGVILSVILVALVVGIIIQAVS